MSFSTDLALSSVDRACAGKAHKVLTITEGLRRARARLRQPTYRPWSPSGRLWGSGVPGTRLVLGPRKPLDCRQLQQPGRRDTTRFFGTRSKASMDWATTHAGPQAIALCQHPELHMARHDDFMTSSQLSDKAPGRFLSVCLNREGLVELCHQNMSAGYHPSRLVPRTILPMPPRPGRPPAVPPAPPGPRPSPPVPAGPHP